MKKLDRSLTESIFEQLARIGKAVASPKRLEVLYLLSQAPRTVDVLAEATHTSQAGMSQHLRALREANLIVGERDGNFMRYRIADERVAEFYRTLGLLAVTHLADLDRITGAYFTGQEAVEPVDREQLLERVRNDEATIIDVRPHVEYQNGHIEGAVSMPLDDLEARLAELPRDQEIVAYCRGPYCVWSGQAVAYLLEQGFRARHLRDGVLDWRAHGLPVSEEARH
ncbi:MAG: ArsR/SmtB family transcription factor [Gammaproteobacteria bacterium]